MGSQQTGEVRSTHTVLIQQVAQSFQAGHFWGWHGVMCLFVIFNEAAEHIEIIALISVQRVSGGKWRFSELEDDVLVILERDRYPAVEAFLRSAFGEPSFGPVDTDDGHQLGELPASSSHQEPRP